MDEPDAPLSFTACLGLVAPLHDLTRAGAPAVVATHSPMIAAVPGARPLELGGRGMRAVGWEELDVVTHWRRILREPDSYFRPWLDG
jgi:predicted ATPase